MRLLIIVLLVSVASVAMAAGKGLSKRWDSVNDSAWTNEYDGHFRKYSKRYFGPHFDWRWFKAQAIAESGLDLKAKSHVGAVGLMQIMPATFAEIKQANPHYLDIETPRWNIAAGIYYDHYLYRKWPKIAEQDRLLMAFASYNAGLGGVLRAYRKAEPPVRTWNEIDQYAPKETQGYVQRIQGLYTEQSEERPPRIQGLWEFF